MLVWLLVMKVLPSIFQHRTLIQEEDVCFAAQLCTIRGGEQLLKVQDKHIPMALIPLVYYLPDEQCNNKAALLITHYQLSVPTLHSKGHGLTLTCNSSLATQHNHEIILYNVFIAFDGGADCNCKDFQSHGGACKHIHAALVSIEKLHNSGISIPLHLFHHQLMVLTLFKLNNFCTY